MQSPFPSDGRLDPTRLASLHVPALDGANVRYRASRGTVIAEVPTGTRSCSVFRWVVTPDGAGAWTRQAGI